ncbi:hypothetical protein CHELA40_20012 [Chelatococcus asaccharovorans]|nr:hypothetical protein CHELA17_10003 [Chelatococcus asaccharovorans]CAH1687159.1 hypothetical protein CHELA40_20012 [Chelatococcus asaccharovorans]
MAGDARGPAARRPPAHGRSAEAERNPAHGAAAEPGDEAMSRLAAIRYAGAATLGILAVAAVGWLGGYRINTTPSYPLGLWRIEALGHPAVIGDLVFICPPLTPAFAMAFERGYIRRGLCPGRFSPLIKTVVAAEGQSVDIGAHVSIDGRHVGELCRDVLRIFETHPGHVLGLMRLELDVIGAPRRGDDDRRNQTRLRWLNDQMDRLAADSTRRGRLDLPAHGVADENVAHDLAGLKLDVADLQRGAHHRWLHFAKQEDDFAVRPFGHEPAAAAPLPGDAGALGLVGTHALRRGFRKEEGRGGESGGKDERQCSAGND